MEEQSRWFLRNRGRYPWAKSQHRQEPSGRAGFHAEIDHDQVRETGQIDRLPRDACFRLHKAEFSFVCYGFTRSGYDISSRAKPEKCKFLLTLPRVNDLLSHSAMYRRHKGAMLHLCLAGEMNLSGALVPCDLFC